MYFTGSQSRLDNLTADLLADYGPNVRPVCPGKETVPVTVDMAVRQLITLVSTKHCKR